MIETNPTDRNLVSTRETTRKAPFTSITTCKHRATASVMPSV